MKDINPKTPIGTKLISRWAPYRKEDEDVMTATLVRFIKKSDPDGGRYNHNPYAYETVHGTRYSYRSQINRIWRIADFSIVGFEGFGYEVTELAEKAAFSVYRAMVGIGNLNWHGHNVNQYHVNDGAMGWAKAIPGEYY